MLATLQLGQNPPSQNWLLELELRDSPMLLTLELTESGAKLRRQNQQIRGKVTKIGPDSVTVTFQSNFMVGAGELKLKLSDSGAEGRLTTNIYQENVHGMLNLASPVKPSTVPVVNGPGFKALGLPAMLMAAKTAGVSIARFEGDKVVEEGSYGVENAATGEPVTATTLFQAGGMGSVLTSLATLKLAGQGKLDLTATVSAVLPELHLAPQNGKEVRILDLLGGSSGLEQYKFRGYPASANPPSLIKLLTGADPDQANPLTLIEPIGEQTGFRGVNHAILQAILERKLGKPFATIMSEVLLKPLGMSHSTFELRPKMTPGVSFVMGHYETGEPLLFGNHIYPMQGDSGLWTTAPEISKVFIEAGRLIAGKPNKFLPEGKKSLLALVDGPKGIVGFARGDGDVYYHGGDTYGQFSNFALYAKKGTGVVVMTNRVMNWRLVGQIIGSIQTK